MTDAPPKLLSAYQAAAFTFGGMVSCARRGEVRITGLSAAPIPWPVGQTLPRGRSRALVLYAGLAEAVRRESAEAVAHWWGVTAHTVTAWRKALGVGQYNEGTTARKSEVLSPVLAKARGAAAPVQPSPERRAKISASKKGKPRPAHVVEAMRKGRTGKPHDAETREAMSASQKARPRVNSWAAHEDELVKTLKP